MNTDTREAHARADAAAAARNRARHEADRRELDAIIARQPAGPHRHDNSPSYGGNSAGRR